MAAELGPGQFEAIFARLISEAQGRSRVALEPIAMLIERQAKINASTGSHRWGTATPATPGTGPARISGTLVRSITHSPVRQVAFGWETRVGLAVGLYPRYRTGRGSFTSKTSSSQYGLYLETRQDNRRGVYPFLGPAFRFVVNGPAAVIYDQLYGGSWMRVV